MTGIHKLTNTELIEPPVTILIDMNKWWRLPQSLRDEMMQFETKPCVLKVPAYRYRQWEKQLRAIEAK